MSCERCMSDMVGEVMGKCSDLCRVEIPAINYEEDGYVPRDLNIGGGDNIRFDVCFSCGQIQGRFPPPKIAELTNLVDETGYLETDDSEELKQFYRKGGYRV